MHHGVWKISLKCGWHWTIFKGLERKKRLYCSSSGLSYFERIEAHSKAEFYTCFSFNHLFLNHPKIFGWNSLIFKQRCEEHHNMISYTTLFCQQRSCILVNKHVNWNDVLDMRFLSLQNPRALMGSSIIFALLSLSLSLVYEFVYFFPFHFNDTSR